MRMPFTYQIKRCGFTLIELLVVICIMGFLVTLSVPAYFRIVKSLDMTNAGQMVISELDNARQAALANNRTVEVRFYKIPEAGATTPQYFRGMQSFLIQDDGSAPALGKVIYLPESVTLSTNVSQSPPLASTPNDPTQNSTAIALPGYNMNYQYIALRLRSNGQMDSNPNMNNWFVTLCKKSVGQVNTSSPGDFITIKVDPVTGRTTSYRQ